MEGINDVVLSNLDLIFGKLTKLDFTLEKLTKKPIKMVRRFYYENK
jgi:hypothetical protein